MSRTPDELRYAKTHEWAAAGQSDLVTVGISDHAQEQLGDVVYVELPETGREVKSGEACAVVESVKAASDIYSPVSGTIVEVNAALADAPEQINQTPYDAWLFRIRGSDPGELGGLLDAAAYQALTGDTA